MYNFKCLDPFTLTFSGALPVTDVLETVAASEETYTARPCARRASSISERIRKGMETQKARVSRMQGRSTAINILEADGAGSRIASPAVGILHETIPASAWRRPTPYLSAAVRRAFSWRYAVLKRTIDILLSSILIVLFFPVMVAVATGGGVDVARADLLLPGKIGTIRRVFPHHQVPFHVHAEAQGQRVRDQWPPSQK